MIATEVHDHVTMAQKPFASVAPEETLMTLDHLIASTPGGYQGNGWMPGQLAGYRCMTPYRGSPVSNLLGWGGRSLQPPWWVP